MRTRFFLRVCGASAEDRRGQNEEIKNPIICYVKPSETRPARGGGKIPGDRSAQRGPEITVKCSYLLSLLYICPK